MRSYDFVPWKIRHRPGRTKPYEVRWVVGRPPHRATPSRSFLKSAGAERFRSDLIQAAKRGEAFDTVSGLPESMMREDHDLTWLAHARAYLREKWPDVSAHSRLSIVESLVAVTPVLVTDVRGKPDSDALRHALWSWTFNPAYDDQDPPDDIARCLDWLERASLPMSELQEDLRHIRAALRACGCKQDGSPASDEYFRRRRRTFYNALKYAVRDKRLTVNPLDDRQQNWKKVEVEETIDPRCVANPQQVADLLAGVTYVGRTQGPRFVAFFGCMYYALMRPSEVSGLITSGCTLPASCKECGADLTGKVVGNTTEQRPCRHEQVVCEWGVLEFSTTHPAVGKQWTDTGEVHETRGLKGRKRKTTRRVPIPPELVALLRWHLDRYGTAPDGRLFRSLRNGGKLHPSTWSRIWSTARTFALAPDQVDSLLAKRPYDLRHAGVTWRLNAGVAPAQVADWAGHSVEVQRRIYERVMAGQDDHWIERMNHARQH